MSEQKPTPSEERKATDWTPPRVTPRRAADIASDIQATRGKLARLEAEMQERAAIEREQWFSMWREMQRRGDV